MSPAAAEVTLEPAEPRLTGEMPVKEASETPQAAAVQAVSLMPAPMQIQAAMPEPEEAPARAEPADLTRTEALTQMPAQPDLAALEPAVRPAQVAMEQAAAAEPRRSRSAAAGGPGRHCLKSRMKSVNGSAKTILVTSGERR
jgi:hypothetical protein